MYWIIVTISSILYLLGVFIMWQDKEMTWTIFAAIGAVGLLGFSMNLYDKMID